MQKNAGMNSAMKGARNEASLPGKAAKKFL